MKTLKKYEQIAISIHLISSPDVLTSSGDNESTFSEELVQEGKDFEW